MNARKKLVTSVAPAMPCKIMKNCGSGASHNIKTNLRVFWKLKKPQECVWEIRYRIIMKTILQEKEKSHYSTTIWFHKFIPMPQAMKIPCSESSGGQGMGKIGENFGVELDKSQK